MSCRFLSERSAPNGLDENDMMQLRRMSSVRNRVHFFYVPYKTDASGLTKKTINFFLRTCVKKSIFLSEKNDEMTILCNSSQKGKNNL